MDRETLEELACDRLVELVDQAMWHQNHDNELYRDLCLAEAEELKDAMGKDDEEVLYMTYHRYLRKLRSRVRAEPRRRRTYVRRSLMSVVRFVMETPATLGVLSGLLIVVPIIGMNIVHKR